MKYAEAFKALGYTIVSPRQHWSAASDTGVCLSIWDIETKYDNGVQWFDSRVHGDDHAQWKDAVGNLKRIEHLKLAESKFGSFVDIVQVTGKPREGYGEAHPWIPAKRQGARWRITFFDQSGGHVAVTNAPP